MTDNNSQSQQQPHDPQKYLIETLSMLQSNPTEAANRFEEMGNRFLELAKRIRQYCTNGIKDGGGANDRVQMRVIGPDGNVKQTIDTGKIT